MNFGELRFWIVLGWGLLLICALRVPVFLLAPRWLQSYDKIALTSLGLYMLGTVSRETLLIFGVVVLTTYWGLRAITRHGHGSVRWLALLIPLQLAPLLYYKYSRFISSEVLGVP